MAESDIDPSVIHFNARVRGMRSELFSRVDIEEMLLTGDIQRMIDRLLESPYRKEMAEALTRHSGADAVEEALSRNLAETYNKLMRIAQGEFKELVALFLHRWDLMAAKSLLRARHHNLDPHSAFQSLIPGPTLTVPVLHDLAQLETMEALVNGLGGWDRTIARRLREALPEYEQTRDLGVLEDVLDRAYFVANARRLKTLEGENPRMLRDELAGEIDRMNLRMVFQTLQGHGDQATLQQRVLPEGRLNEPQLLAMAAAGDVSGALDALSGTRYSGVSEDLQRYLSDHRFSPVERFFDRLLMGRLRRAANQEVFGIGVMMNFVWLKYNEVINLRLIARGLAGNLPKARVEEELYYVA